MKNIWLSVKSKIPLLNKKKERSPIEVKFDDAKIHWRIKLGDLERENKYLLTSIERLNMKIKILEQERAGKESASRLIDKFLASNKGE